MTAESSFGGGVLQPKERPLGSRVRIPAPKASPSRKGAERSQIGRTATTDAEGKRTEGARPQPPRASISTPGSRAQVPHLKAAAADRPMAVRRPCHRHPLRKPAARRSARGGLRLPGPKRAGPLQVTQHHLQPPHCAARRGKRSTSQEERAAAARAVAHAGAEPYL